MSETSTSLIAPADACRLLFERHGIRRTPGTLAKARCAEDGPEFVRVKRAVFYRPEALDAWATSIVSPAMRSTHKVAEPIATVEHVRLTSVDQQNAGRAAA